jgi:hypothetical protein
MRILLTSIFRVWAIFFSYYLFVPQLLSADVLSVGPNQIPNIAFDQTKKDITNQRYIEGSSRTNSKRM